METIEFLRKQFEYYTEQHGLAIQNGNGKIANRWNRRIRKSHEHIQKGKFATMYKDFLTHKNEFTRLWAAGYCRDNFPKESKAVLKNLLKSSDPYIQICAEADLQSLKKHRVWWRRILSSNYIRRFIIFPLKRFESIRQLTHLENRNKS